MTERVHVVATENGSHSAICNAPAPVVLGNHNRVTLSEVRQVTFAKSQLLGRGRRRRNQLKATHRTVVVAAIDPQVGKEMTVVGIEPGALLHEDQFGLENRQTLADAQLRRGAPQILLGMLRHHGALDLKELELHFTMRRKTDPFLEVLNGGRGYIGADLRDHIVG